MFVGGRLLLQPLEHLLKVKINAKMMLVTLLIQSVQVEQRVFQPKMWLVSYTTEVLVASLGTK